MPVFTLYMKESLCYCLLCDRVANPHSLYRFSNDTDLVNLVTSRAASFWIFCSVTESCSEQPSHTADAYSIIGNRHIHLVKSISIQRIFQFSHNSQNACC